MSINGLWNQAKTYDNLLVLMQIAIKEGLRTPWSYASPNGLLEEDSRKYIDDYLLMNKLGFLTCDSQTGLLEVIKNEPICYSTHKTRGGISFQNNDSKFTDTYIYEQREYIEGIITKDKLYTLVNKLTDCIITVEPIVSKPNDESDRKLFDSRSDERDMIIIDANEFNQLDSENITKPILIMEQHLNHLIIEYNGAKPRKYINLTYKMNQIYTQHRTNLRLETNYDKVSHDLEANISKTLFNWMLENTFNICIASTSYNTNHLNKQIIHILQDLKS